MGKGEKLGTSWFSVVVVHIIFCASAIVSVSCVNPPASRDRVRGMTLNGLASCGLRINEVYENVLDGLDPSDFIEIKVVYKDQSK